MNELTLEEKEAIWNAAVKFIGPDYYHRPRREYFEAVCRVARHDEHMLLGKRLAEARNRVTEQRSMMVAQD